MCPADHFYEHKNAWLIFKKNTFFSISCKKKKTNKKRIYALFLVEDRKLNFLATDWLKAS